MPQCFPRTATVPVRFRPCAFHTALSQRLPPAAPCTALRLVAHAHAHSTLGATNSHQSSGSGLRPDCSPGREGEGPFANGAWPGRGREPPPDLAGPPPATPSEARVGGPLAYIASLSIFRALPPGAAIPSLFSLARRPCGLSSFGYLFAFCRLGGRTLGPDTGPTAPFPSPPPPPPSGSRSKGQSGRSSAGPQWSRRVGGNITPLGVDRGRLFPCRNFVGGNFPALLVPKGQRRSLLKPDARNQRSGLGFPLNESAAS